MFKRSFQLENEIGRRFAFFSTMMDFGNSAWIAALVRRSVLTSKYLIAYGLNRLGGTLGCKGAA